MSLHNYKLSGLDKIILIQNINIIEKKVHNARQNEIKNEKRERVELIIKGSNFRIDQSGEVDHYILGSLQLVLAP